MDATQLNAFYDSFVEVVSKNRKDLEITPEYLCKVIAHIADSYKYETLLTYTNDFNTLVNYVCKNNNPVITSYVNEISDVFLTQLSYFKRETEQGQTHLKHNVLNEDVLNAKIPEKLFDMCVAIPQFTHLKHEKQELDYVIRLMDMSKYGIFIIPSKAIDGSSWTNQVNLLHDVSVIKIINLGDCEFKQYIKEISIMICVNKNIKQVDKTIIQHLDYSELEEILNGIDQNKHSYEMTLSKNWNWSEYPTLYEGLKLHDDYKGKETDLTLLKDLIKKYYKQRFERDISKIEFEEIKTELDKYENKLSILNLMSDDKFVKVKLSDIFERVVVKSIKFSEVDKENSTEAKTQVIGTSKFNNGIVGRTFNDYTVEASKEKPVWTVIKNGCPGYAFKHEYNFAVTNGVMVIKPKENLHSINSEIITSQLINMDFGNILTVEKFYKLEIYIYRP